MRPYELAKRYAKAVSDLAIENKTQEKVFNDLRSISEIFSKDASIKNFLTTPMIQSTEREAVLAKALDAKGVSTEALDLVLLLAKRNRLALFSDIVTAFQAETDASNNLCRGTVRSATALGQTERHSIEQTVERVLKKKVIMTYKVDPSVIGGLVAQVGSYTFDDSIASHLNRMNEELKRRTV